MELVIFAGVNGSGKSTIYHTTGNINEFRVNSDEILRSFNGDWQNMQDQQKAGKEAIRLTDFYLENKFSFNIETTLCGHHIIKIIERAKELGYTIHMYYISLSSPDEAIKRIKSRVEQGGHGISEDVVKRRYYSSFQNLNKVLNKCNNILFYDNSTSMDLIAHKIDQKIYITNKSVPWFSDNIQPNITRDIKQIIVTSRELVNLSETLLASRKKAEVNVHSTQDSFLENINTSRKNDDGAI